MNHQLTIDKQSMTFVQYINPAYNNSLVILLQQIKMGLFKPVHKIRHIDSKGFILKDIQIHNVEYKFHMLNQFEVILAEVDALNNLVYVSILNLQNYELKKKIKIDGYNAKFNLFTFKQTNSLILLFRNKTQIGIQYYNYDQLDSGPTHTWAQKSDHRYDVCKVDQHSGIAIWKEGEINQNPFCFQHMFISDKHQLCFKNIITKNSLKDEFQNVKERITVLNIKKYEENSFFVFTNAYINAEVSIVQIKTKTNSEDSRIKRCDSLWKGRKQMCCIPYSTFFAERIHEKDIGQNKLYSSQFINYETRRTLRTVKHQLNHGVSYCEVGWNERMIVWFSQNYDDKTDTSLIIKNQLLVDEKYYLRLLLKVNEDFDDDLLYDALTLLNLLEDIK